MVFSKWILEVMVGKVLNVASIFGGRILTSNFIFSVMLTQVDDWPYVDVSFPSSYNPPTNFGWLRIDVDFQYMGQSAWVTYTSTSYTIRALGNGLKTTSVRLRPGGAPGNRLQLSMQAVVTIEVRAVPSGTASIERTVAT